MKHGVDAIAADEHVRVLALDDLIVVLAMGRPTAASIDLIDRAIRKRARAAAPQALLIVVAEDARPPDGDARGRARAMFAGFVDHVRLYATVFEGAGFLVAAKRSVFTFVSSVLTGSVPGHVGSDLPGAVAWMAAHEAARSLRMPGARAVERAIADARGA